MPIPVPPTPELPESARPRRSLKTTNPRSVSVLLSSLETTGVLAATIVVWALISFPFWPIEMNAEFPLLATSSEPTTAETDTELIARIDALDLAGRVQIVDRQGSRFLVLGDVSSIRRLKAVHEAVNGSGYYAGRMHFSAGLVAEADSDLILTLGLQAGMFLAVGWAMARFRLTRRRRIWPALPAMGLGLAGGLAAILVSTVISASLAVLGLPVQEQEWLQQLFGDSRNLLLLAPWVVIFLPMAEEVFFRGYVLRLISRRGSRLAGIVISSVMFSALHFNPSGFAIYLVLGALFGWLQLRTSNLLAPILAHISYNGLALLFAVMTS